MARIDPLRNFRYRLEIDSITAGFSEVTITETTVEAVDYREGIDLPYPQARASRSTETSPSRVNRQTHSTL
jgi:hypothetical protein